jgi:hypothetical protein
MGWRIYFFIMIVILLWESIALFSDSLSITVNDHLNIAISLFSLTGLFGYAFKKLIFRQDFWAYWFLVLVFWDLIYNLHLSYVINTPEFLDGLHNLYFVLIIVLLPIAIRTPLYISLFLYGFRSKSLWKK